MFKIGIIVDSKSPDQWLQFLAMKIREKGYEVFLIEIKVPLNKKVLPFTLLTKFSKLFLRDKGLTPGLFYFPDESSLELDLIIDPTGKIAPEYHPLPDFKNLIYISYDEEHYSMAGLNAWLAGLISVDFKINHLNRSNNSQKSTQVFKSRSNLNSFYLHQQALFYNCAELIVIIIDGVFGSDTPAGVDWKSELSFPVKKKSNSNLYRSFFLAINLFIVSLLRLIRYINLKLLFIEEWRIIYGKKSDLNKNDLSKFQTIPNRAGFYNADPFLLVNENKIFIFFEEFSRQKNRGHISCISLDTLNSSGSQKVILETPYHLSYPFIFKNNGKWYMIPESSENATIDLYECLNFPFEWSFVKTLIKDIQALDSTIIFDSDRFWLFCTVKTLRKSSSDAGLYIYSTDDLLKGIWQPHKKNPQKFDFINSRPAGKFFNLGSKIIRPAQICLPIYGWGIKFNETTRLDSESFREIELDQLTPLSIKSILALHTYNEDNGYVALDIKIRMLRFKMYLNTLAALFSKKRYKPDISLIIN